MDIFLYNHYHLKMMLIYLHFQVKVQLYAPPHRWQRQTNDKFFNDSILAFIERGNIVKYLKLRLNLCRDGRSLLTRMQHFEDRKKRAVFLWKVNDGINF